MSLFSLFFIKKVPRFYVVTGRRGVMITSETSRRHNSRNHFAFKPFFETPLLLTISGGGSVGKSLPLQGSTSHEPDPWRTTHCKRGFVGCVLGGFICKNHIHTAACVDSPLRWERKTTA
jgi:hypothetical protein